MFLHKTILSRALVRHNKFINFAPVVFRSISNEKFENFNQSYSKYGAAVAAALFGSVIIGTTITELDGKHKKPELRKAENATFEAGDKRPDLPTYTAEEVYKHNTKSTFWVIYKNGVYDVTEFLPSHPGGDQILNAAGLSIEPFWNVYGMHKTPEVFQLLEQYRIGNLAEADVCSHEDEELWAREPRRDPRLLLRTARPFNAETPPDQQILHFDTPNELFYVRQHMPVPELDAESHRLTVTVKGHATTVTRFSLAQLEKFPRTSVRAALMCAGNRRSEMAKVEEKSVKGISWSGGAVSSAVWGGVYLRDVLLRCGVDQGAADAGALHVILTGADIDATGTRFSTSIPLHLAMDPASEVLLATHMNGAALPPDHGRPLRAVVPGAPAVRSVKWLESITVSEEESSSHWHQKDYRAFNPSKTWETADFSTAPPVYSLPVTSAICQPQHGDTVRVRDGCVEVKGYAYSGGGAAVLRVDVSADRGRSWAEAELCARDPAPPRRHYAWTLWRVALPLQPGQKEMELWVKATDSNFNTQPEKFDDIWNIRGILSNAYHKITVQLEH